MVFKPMHSAHRPIVQVAAPPRPQTTTLIPDKRNQRAADLPSNRCKRCRTGTAIWEAMPCGHLLYCDGCKRQVLSRTFKRCSICRVRIMNFVRAGVPRPAAAAGSGGPRPAAAGGSAGPQPAAAAAGSGGSQPAAAAAALRPTTVSSVADLVGTFIHSASAAGAPQPDAAAVSVASAIGDSTAVSDPQPAAAAGGPQPAVAAALLPTTVSVADLVGTFIHSASVAGAPQPASAIADPTAVSDAPSN